MQACRSVHLCNVYGFVHDVQGSVPAATQVIDGKVRRVDGEEPRENLFTGGEKRG
jgi:hypothetical protein